MELKNASMALKIPACNLVVNKKAAKRAENAINAIFMPQKRCLEKGKKR